MAQTSSKEEIPEVLRLITAQFWQVDLDLLAAVARQRGREPVASLRRAALHAGSLIVAASGPPDRETGLYGTYTAEGLAEELASSLLIIAVHFLERQGYSVTPLPAAITSLVELLTHIGQAGYSITSPQRPEAGMGGQARGPTRETGTRTGQVTLSEKAARTLNIADSPSI